MKAAEVEEVQKKPKTRKSRDIEKEHPLEEWLRMDRIPHIWCATCGLGTTVTALATAIDQLNLDYDDITVVSGIGCTGRVAGYMKVDSFHTTHGRAMPFAVGMHIARPDLKTIVFSGRAMEYATRIRWTLSKAQDTAIAVRDLNRD